MDVVENDLPPLHELVVRILGHGRDTEWRGLTPSSAKMIRHAQTHLLPPAVLRRLRPTRR